MNKSSEFTGVGEKGYSRQRDRYRQRLGGHRAGSRRGGSTRILNVCAFSCRRSGQGRAAPASGVNHQGALGGTMVHGLRGHQAVLLPVHHPQVRGWASLSTPSPLDFSAQSPAPGSRWRDPSIQSSVSRAGPEPAGTRGESRTDLVPAIRAFTGWWGRWMVCKKQTWTSSSQGC